MSCGIAASAPVEISLAISLSSAVKTAAARGEAVGDTVDDGLDMATDGALETVEGVVTGCVAPGPPVQPASMITTSGTARANGDAEIRFPMSVDLPRRVPRGPAMIVGYTPARDVRSLQMVNDQAREGHHRRQARSTVHEGRPRDLGRGTPGRRRP